MARLSIDSIQKQIQKLQLQAAKLEQEREQRKAKAVKRVFSLMRELGVDMEDLNHASVQTRRRGRPPKRPSLIKSGEITTTSRPVAPKYRHPESGNTWTGRGKVPRWLASEIRSGKSREDFLIAVQ